jgi:hypothetical protein
MRHRLHENVLQRVAFEIHPADFNAVQIRQLINMTDIDMVGHDDLDALRFRVDCRIAAETAGRIEKGFHLSVDLELQELPIRTAFPFKVAMADDFSASEDYGFVAALFNVGKQVR